MAVLLDGAMETIRQLASDLRPLILADLGLAATIQQEVIRMREQTGLHFDVGPLAEDHGLSKEAALALYRIFQAALTNVLQHAQASQVQIRLERGSGSVVMVIADDGRGIAREALDSPDSVGLIGMRERVTALGGTCEIGARPGAGSTVRVTLPQPPETGAA